jgi:hypothetical protein
MEEEEEQEELTDLTAIRVLMVKTDQMVYL